jgi:hypothetical protein
MIQLNLFEEYKPPHIKFWDDFYAGWQPKVGAICRTSCGYVKHKDPNLGTSWFCEYGMTAYIIALDDEKLEAEIVLPFLKQTPWCKEKHLISEYKNLEPQIRYGFNEAQWREENPISELLKKQLEQ